MAFVRFLLSHIFLKLFGYYFQMRYASFLDKIGAIGTDYYEIFYEDMQNNLPNTLQVYMSSKAHEFSNLIPFFNAHFAIDDILEEIV